MPLTLFPSLRLWKKLCWNFFFRFTASTKFWKFRHCQCVAFVTQYKEDVQNRENGIRLHVFLRLYPFGFEASAFSMHSLACTGDTQVRGTCVCIAVYSAHFHSVVSIYSTWFDTTKKPLITIINYHPRMVWCLKRIVSTGTPRYMTTTTTNKKQEYFFSRCNI